MFDKIFPDEHTILSDRPTRPTAIRHVGRGSFTPLKIYKTSQIIRSDFFPHTKYVVMIHVC